jgi:diacylglycerol kinase (ATP)
MRVAAILGLGCSSQSLKPFQADNTLEWRFGVPASSDQIDVILLFGGDGTVHRYLSQLVKLAVPVLIVPAGSGNDFARALGFRHVRESVAAWRKFCAAVPAIRTIDLGIITPLVDADDAAARQENSRYFCCAAGVGLDGEVARRANRLPRWLRARGGYVLSLVPAIFRFAPLPMKILTSSDSQDLENPAEPPSWTTRSHQPTILAVIANTPTYGGGMKIAPNAKIDDGLLDVCVVAGMDAFKLFCMFPTVYSGRHLRIREVEYFQASRLRVETEYPLEVYADGEYVCRTPIEVTVQRGALKVVTP